MLMNNNNQEKPRNHENIKTIYDGHRSVLGYLALIKLAEKYSATNERSICKEIGKVAMDIIEPEFAIMDRRNLIERKKFLENELETIRKIKRIDDYEDGFIKYAKLFTESSGISADDLINIGVPHSTLKLARII